MLQCPFVWCAYEDSGVGEVVGQELANDAFQARHGLHVGQLKLGIFIMIFCSIILVEEVVVLVGCKYVLALCARILFRNGKFPCCDINLYQYKIICGINLGLEFEYLGNAGP